MAIITELLAPRARKEVAWFRNLPPDVGGAFFRSRDFVVTSCNGEDLRKEDRLAGLAAVVFTQNATKLNQVADDVRNFAEKLLDFDCRLIVRPAVANPDIGINPIDIIARAIRSSRLPAYGLDFSDPLPHIRVFDCEFPWKDIANYVAAHPPERPPAPVGELTITTRNKSGGDFELPEGEEVLIRRAFADCAEVHLSKMGEQGRSGASVYRAFTELMGGQFGQWPVPYFVKIGTRKQTLAEFENYEEYVVPYVPFHLGPHLVRQRCCLGTSKGILVGNYVEEAESLIRCAQDGRAASALACLFDRTLHGWYRNTMASRLPISKSLRLPRRIAEARFARAEELGAKKPLDVLRSLCERCTSTPVVFGPIHGDLHGGNVLVRGNDAVVIDLYAHRESAPLVRDLASLEASLLVDGFESVTRERVDVWQQSIAGLYEASPLSTLPPHCTPYNSSAWFYACVRQIRLYAQRLTNRPDQYWAALAAALLMKAAKDPDAPEPEASRRAVAYVMAEKILTMTFDPNDAEYCI